MDNLPPIRGSAERGRGPPDGGAVTTGPCRRVGATIDPNAPHTEPVDDARHGPRKRHLWASGRRPRPPHRATTHKPGNHPYIRPSNSASVSARALLRGALLVPKAGKVLSLGMGPTHRKRMGYHQRRTCRTRLSSTSYAQASHSSATASPTRKSSAFDTGYRLDSQP